MRDAAEGNSATEPRRGGALHVVRMQGRVFGAVAKSADLLAAIG
jgi:hypothetical protein